MAVGLRGKEATAIPLGLGPRGSPLAMGQASGRAESIVVSVKRHGLRWPLVGGVKSIGHARGKDKILIIPPSTTAWMLEISASFVPQVRVLVYVIGGDNDLRRLHARRGSVIGGDCTRTEKPAGLCAEVLRVRNWRRQ
jgi:hypothetical protein